MFLCTHIQILASAECLRHQHFDIYAGINRFAVAALFTNARWTCPKPHAINASNIIIVTIKTSKSLTKSPASTPTLPSSAIPTDKKAESTLKKCRKKKQKYINMWFLYVLCANPLLRSVERSFAHAHTLNSNIINHFTWNKRFVSKSDHDNIYQMTIKVKSTMRMIMKGIQRNTMPPTCNNPLYTVSCFAKIFFICKWVRWKSNN